MAENQYMCMYCEETGNPWVYLCKSPGNPEPGRSYIKDQDHKFKKYCRHADENGYPASCSKFVKPAVPVTDSGKKPNTTKDSLTDGQPERRARERLTYLSQMDANKQPDIQPVDVQPQPDIQPVNTQPRQDGQSAEEQGSSTVEDILKEGAKAVVDMGKSLLNPMGAGADLVADMAKKLIDEL